jgi:hypothetical protein
MEGRTTTSVRWIDELVARHGELAAGDTVQGEITVVFDARQNSVANFAHLDQSHLHFVGSIPPSDCADLLKRPAGARRLVDEPRFGGLTALETRRTVYGQDPASYSPARPPCTPLRAAASTRPSPERAWPEDHSGLCWWLPTFWRRDHSAS